jgi:hypothetical protein
MTNMREKMGEDSIKSLIKKHPPYTQILDLRRERRKYAFKKREKKTK